MADRTRDADTVSIPAKKRRKRHHSRKRRTQHVIAALISRDGNRCAYCRQPFNEARPATIDHVIPYCQNGTNELDNLVAACRPCNESKGAISAEEFRNRVVRPERNRVALADWLNGVSS